VNLKKLVDLPAGKHSLENTAMIRVGKSDQISRKPSVELCPARPTALESRVDAGGDLVVLTTKSAVSLHVALLEQHLQHDELGVQRVDSLRPEKR
jgi:hypothetical protein